MLLFFLIRGNPDASFTTIRKKTKKYNIESLQKECIFKKLLSFIFIHVRKIFYDNETLK